MFIKAPSSSSRRGRGRRSVSDDGEHQLDTRSPIRGFKPFVPVPISKPIKYMKRSEDDELFERGFDAEEFEEEY
jgi:hypothetical protein